MMRFFASVLLFYLFFAVRPTFAADPQFDISVDTLYDIDTKGMAAVTQEIKITNKTEFYYTPTYTITVGFENVENIQAYNSDGSIPATIDDKSPSGKSIKLSFPKRYAGLNESNTFTLKFTTDEIAKKLGEIWEVTIPGIDKPETFSSYRTKISVPDEFGKPSIIKPSMKMKGKNIELSKDELGGSGIYVLFGEKQYYKFNLSYNISNPNLFPVRTEIALPSKTNYQNVSLTNFSENPLDVTQDQDGNWIAEYRLLPQEKKKITVSGVVEVLAIPSSEELTSRQLKEYTTQKKYWNSNDPTIKKEVESLKTAEDIYRYVVKTLTYNYSKVASENMRLGGDGALKDPKNSVCLEFSDLFVTLARAKGIPARAVEGFAFTQNSRTRPLSLVSDILHAWPEYYDEKQKKWIMIDPTWGNTTKGMDYFSTIDLSHISFVKKGFDSEYPIPAGGYKFSNDSKDVDVRFASKSDFVADESIVIEDTFPNYSFPGVKLQGSFLVKNVGTIPIIDTVASVTTSEGTKRTFDIDYIPPYGTKKITTTFDDVPFLTNSNYNITMQVEDATHNKAVRISFIPDTQILLIIGGLIGGSTIIAAITFHTGSLLVRRHKRKNTLRR